MSVDDSPASTTDAPRSRAPSAKARARPGPDSRMSCAVTILAAPVTSRNAAPMARAIVSSSWSGTTPRTSYALTRAERSTTNPRFAGLIGQACPGWLAYSQSHLTEVRAGSVAGRHDPEMTAAPGERVAVGAPQRRLRPRPPPDGRRGGLRGGGGAGPRR